MTRKRTKARKITAPQLATLKLSWSLLKEAQGEMQKVWFDITTDHIGNSELCALDEMFNACESVLRLAIDRNGGNTND
jgi:hypothetical protein